MAQRRPRRPPVAGVKPARGGCCQDSANSRARRPSLHAMADAPAASAALEDILTCSVCLEVMCDPVTISPCGHSCCCACIEKWLQRSYKCPCCAALMRHAALSYSLRAVVERLHGPALAARRTRLGHGERHTYSVTVADSPLYRLPLAEPVVARLAMLHAQLAVFFPRLANLGWRDLAAAWFVLFVASFCGIQWALATDSAALAYWPVPLASPQADGQAAAWDVLQQHAAALPSLVAHVFVISFVFFFCLFLSVQWLMQRRWFAALLL